MGEVIYKEITPYPDNTDRWKDITINSGASQRTLDDIKLPETAGCFTYGGDQKHTEGTNNRFIYWRTYSDVMELVEVSLDVNLRGNCLRLHFERSPILQGVSIHERVDQVVILLSTISTVHKLIFPHPRKLDGMSHFWKQSDAILPSIFFDASIAKIHSHSSFYVLNQTMSAKVPLPQTSCSWLMPNGDAAFVLASKTGSHLLVVMDEQDEGKVTVAELKRTSMMSRLWNGLTRNTQSGEVALSIVYHQDTFDTYIFSLCRDLRIRMWSYKKQECLMMASVFEHQDQNGNIPACNSQQCYLKKSIGTSPQECYIAVYISQLPQNQFLIFQSVLMDDQYRLLHIATLYHEKHDLVDFCLNSCYVWTLWLNSESEPVVKMTAIESIDEKIPVRVAWLDVNLEPPVSKIPVIAPMDDEQPREAYLKEIFRQGRFSPSTVSKAITIYRRIADASSFLNTTPSGIGTLREEAVKAVENEIFARTRETDLTHDERQILEIECWEKFFSYCIQYHEVGTKPLGLAYDPTAGYVIVIKKNIYSLLCPCDTMEQLLLSKIDSYNPMACSLNPIVKEDTSLSNSILSVFQCLSMVRSCLTEEMTVRFQHDMHHLLSPQEIATELIRGFEMAPGDAVGCLLMRLQDQLKLTENILPALQLLLQKVDLSFKDAMEESNDIDVTPFMDCPYFLSGSAGISILCEGVSQFALQRFDFCRDMLILELIITRLGDSSGISLDVLTRMEIEIIPSTRQLVHAYYVMKWCTECEYVPNQAPFLETGFKNLSLLDMSNINSPSKYLSDNGIGKTVVYYFLMDMGRKDAYSLLTSLIPLEDCNYKNSTQILPFLVLNVAKILWSLGPHFQFPEYLLNQCQYLQLQGYVRLLESWCDWNVYSRKFLLASCLLMIGENSRSLQLFVQVADGVEKEEYLHNKIMQGIDDTSASPVAQYYMKIIHMFEHFELSECIITLATTVIRVLDKNDPNIATFWSLVFKHHLELGNNDEAYTALTRNPDQSRQKDCLRQIIVVLCERRQFQTLVEFSYMNLHDEVISILESRARSSDLLKQEFYDLLYAFHIHTNNFRKAATITFEYGLRLSQEVNTLEGLRKQASCYLMAINCLCLVDVKYQWIVKPVPRIVEHNGVLNENPGMSPKRNADGEEIYSLGDFRKVQVLDIADIRKEYDLIHARLMLAEKDQFQMNMAATPLSAKDCVSLLVQAGFFDTAIELCKSYSLSLIPIFDGLTNRCIELLQSKSLWLKENDMKLRDWLEQNESGLLSSGGYLSAQEQLWYLLKHYLEQHENPGDTLFHRCIATRLLTFGFTLPAWLKQSYQRSHPAELLLLYINFGLLEDATDLAVDYIDSVLEHRQTDFGIKYPLQETSPPVWLPHTYLDALLEALEDVQNEVHCTELYEKLRAKVNEYQQKATLVSERTIASVNMMIL